MKYTKTAFLIAALTVVFSRHAYGQQSPVSVYGYLDLVARNFFTREFPNGAAENPPSTFNLLRTHILLNSRFSENWQAFVNIRFLNGGNIGAERHNNKGHIEILEGWFEYRIKEWLRIRGGQFLAPFGYFNTRKFQSPVFNSVVLPVMYEEEFLQRASAGTIIPPLQNLQLSGELKSEKWRFGYHFYTGNGTSTDASNLDVNANKNLGLRLRIEPPIQNVTIGASYFTEKGNFSIRPHPDMKAMMMKARESGIPMSAVVPILPEVIESETRRTWGVDTRYLWGNFELRGEFVTSRISGLSLIDASEISDTTQTYRFDGSFFTKTFYYLHVNYTFFERLTPFFEINVFEDPRHFVFRNELRRLTWGLAFRPQMNTVFKAEIHNHLFGDKFNRKPNHFKSFAMIWFAVSVFFN